MNASPLSLIDRLPARSTLRGFTYSFCGILGTVVLILVTLWMYVDLVSAYSKGLYFQSSFETQLTAYQDFQSPYDIKMAIVFFNKSSNAIANHSELLSFFNPKIYTAFAYLNPQYQETVATCDPDYFADAINPVSLSSCYTFTPNKTFTYAYQPGTSNAFSIVGFYFTYNCFNPFFCATRGSTLVSVQSNLVALFRNYSATFYFSTRVLQPNGAFRHQVYYISSGQFNSPTTISGQFDAEVVVSNITMDYSIMPWTNILSTSNLGYYGQMKGSTKNTSNIFAPLPRFDTMASNYQNLVFRYYKKEDWMLGIVGGGAFLIYFALLTVCYTFNQGLSRANSAE